MKNGTTTTVTSTAPSALSGIVVVQRDFRIPTPPRIYKTKQLPFVVLEVVLLVEISDPGVVVLDGGDDDKDRSYFEESEGSLWVSLRATMKGFKVCFFG